MSPKDTKTKKKTTRKPRTSKKLSKAEKLKAEAERLLIEAAAAEDEEEDEEEEEESEDDEDYTEKGLKKMKLSDLRIIAKDHGLTTQHVTKGDLIGEILDVQEARDEDIDSSEVVDVEFDNAGAFDRESGVFEPTDDYKRFFRSIDFKEMKQKIFDRLNEKEDFEWFIIATDVTKAKGQDGIFMRLSQSGESFIFYIHERLFCIPISHIDSEEFDNIGVSEVTFN